MCINQKSLNLKVEFVLFPRYITYNQFRKQQSMTQITDDIVNNLNMIELFRTLF
jgi:hypothetical protein